MLKSGVEARARAKIEKEQKPTGLGDNQMVLTRLRQSEPRANTDTVCFGCLGSSLCSKVANAVITTREHFVVAVDQEGAGDRKATKAVRKMANRPRILPSPAMRVTILREGSESRLIRERMICR